MSASIFFSPALRLVSLLSISGTVSSWPHLIYLYIGLDHSPDQTLPSPLTSTHILFLYINPLPSPLPLPHILFLHINSLSSPLTLPHILLLYINCHQHMCLNNMTSAPTPTSFLSAGRQNYSIDTSSNGMSQTSGSTSVENMAAPQLEHGLSSAGSSDYVTACRTGHAHSLSDCIKHCSNDSTNNAAFGIDSNSGIQTRARGVSLWTCCDCGESGQTVRMISCSGCGCPRCENCYVYSSHK